MVEEHANQEDIRAACPSYQREKWEPFFGNFGMARK
jgi:hypothetical protein